jgi:L-lactate dehydrogenase
VADYVRVGLGLPRFRCFGTGTLLDTARLVRQISIRAGVPAARVSALVMGEHGDSSVSVLSQTRIDGKPAREFPSLDANELNRETRQGGMTILAGKGHTEFGIGQATASLCAALTGAKPGRFPLSVALEGEYAQTGIHAGVPCDVGPAGIERIVDVDLNPAEKAAFAASCDIIRGYVKRARPGA